MSTYSFMNVQATITGPGVNATVTGSNVTGAAQLGNNAGAAKEGIDAEYEEDKGTVTTGADGSIMTSLHAGQTGRFVIRLLKVSPINAVLSQAYNYQRQSAANWGINTLRIVDKARGDVATLLQAQFVKHANNAWKEDGNILEWTFQGIMNETLGAGIPSLTSNP